MVHHLIQPLGKRLLHPPHHFLLLFHRLFWQEDKTRWGMHAVLMSERDERMGGK